LTIFFDVSYAPKTWEYKELCVPEEGPQLGRKLSANASSRNFVAKDSMVGFKEFAMQWL
jgi:hypothetical protein